MCAILRLTGDPTQQVVITSPRNGDRAINTQMVRESEHETELSSLSLVLSVLNKPHNTDIFSESILNVGLAVNPVMTVNYTVDFVVGVDNSYVNIR